jgi:hypothetical protein
MANALAPISARRPPPGENCGPPIGGVTRTILERYQNPPRKTMCPTRCVAPPIRTWYPGCMITGVDAMREDEGGNRTAVQVSTRLEPEV